MTLASRRKNAEVTGFRLILGYLGIFMVLIGIINALPMIVVAFYREEVAALPVFGGVAGCNIILGLALYFIFIFRRKRSRFFRRQESVLLMFLWILAVISGGAPFYILNLMGKINMSFAGSFFEAASGYSTTGLTVFSDFIDVDGAFCPHILTFHRAFMNFIGGVGLVLLVASVLGTGGGGMSLYVSEGHSDRLVPNIAKSAKLIFGIYSLYASLGVIALMLAGMPAFDAVCHSMSAISGGGFSPRAANVAAYRLLDGQVLPGAFVGVSSLAIEIIIMVLVVFSAISFMLHMFFLRGRFRDFFRDDEIRMFAASVVIAMLVIFGSAMIATASTRSSPFADSLEILRVDAFYVIGSITNSGFASTTGNKAEFAYHIIDGGSNVFLGHGMVLTLIILMLMGGGAGSSAGGVKQYRVVVAIRSLVYSLRYRFASSHHLYPKLTNRYGDTKELDDDTVYDAFHYIFLFVGMYVFITLFVMVVDPEHYNIETSAFDVASAVSNTGLSWVIGPAYVSSGSAASTAVLWAMSIGMLLGRLEILPAAYAISNAHLEFRYRRQQREIRKRERRKMLDEDLYEGE